MSATHVPTRSAQRLFGIAMTIWGFVGALFLLTGWFSQTIPVATVVYLVLGAVYAGLVLAKRLEPKARAWLIGAILVFGFGFEVIGVNTGWPFGHYDYTHLLQPQLFHVPIILAAAWLLVTGLSFAVVSPDYHVTVRVALRSFIAVGMDFLIDPVSANIDHFWRWQSSGFYYHVPLQNFLAWFLIECLLQFIICLFERSERSTSRIAVPFASLFVVFAVPCVQHGWWWPIGIAILCPLCASGIAWRRE